MAEAAQVAAADAELGAQLDAQVSFDAQMLKAIRAIEPPREFVNQLDALTDTEAQGAPLLRLYLFHPAMLSVIMGVALILGFLVWVEMDRLAAFPGKDSVQQIVAIAQEMNGTELESSSVPAGELSDVFYMRGFEGFALPPQIARMPTIGHRLFKQGGHPVAQLAVSPHDALLYVFRAADFGVHLGAEWQVFTQEEWVAAISEDNGICSVLAFRGSRDEMKVFLRDLKP